MVTGSVVKDFPETNKHLESHLMSSKELVCSNCGGHFTQNLDHQQGHGGVAASVCPQCWKSFRGQSKLEGHLSTHFAKKLSCSGSHLKNSPLPNHQKVPAEENPNSFIDGRKCSNSNSTPAHQRNQSREKHYTFPHLWKVMHPTLRPEQTQKDPR